MADRSNGTGADDQPIEETVTEDLGGWQGTPPDEDQADATAQQAKPGVVPDAPAPDGAEIEWAGGAIRKPPSPTAERQ